MASQDISNPQYRAFVEGQDYFVGWEVEGTTTRSVTCERGGVFSTWGSYAECCEGTCASATECNNRVLTHEGSSTRTCGSAFDCATLLLYSTYGEEDSESPRSRVLCARNLALTAFREIPAETTTSSSSDSSTPSATSTFSSAGLGTPSPTSTDTEAGEGGDGDGGSGSMAWIAGAVVGPLVLIAAIGLAIWFIRRRKRKGAVAAAASSAPPAGQPPMGQQYQQQYGHPGMGQQGQQGYHDPNAAQMWQQQQQQQQAYGMPPKSVSPAVYGLQGYYAAPGQQGPMELDANGTAIGPPPQELATNPPR